MTKQTTTLAQISDLHLPSSNWVAPRYWNLKRVLGFLNWQRGRRFVHRLETLDLLVADMKARKPDHIVVTGDLVNLGLPQEYHAALVWLKSLGHSDRVSVIPGNHDIYSSNPGVSCLNVWAPYMASDAFGRSCGLNQADVFPFVRQIGPMALIAVNSAKPTLPFSARGKVGAPQRHAVEVALQHVAQAGLLSCVVIHHPPLPGLTADSRALEDADRFAHLMNQCSVGFVIHGHNHRDVVTWATGVERDFAVCGAASGSLGRSYGSETLARYYLYELQGEGPEMQVTRIARGLDPDRNRVVELERTQLLPDGSGLR